jgi:hypothetical protein
MKEFVHRILDIISSWERFGQWLFFIFMTIVFIGVLFWFMAFICVVIHGWPPGMPNIYPIPTMNVDSGI